jgi:pimeloyl-ACP methyl ester carboxylesterase
VRRRGPDPSSVRLPGPWTHRGVSANGIGLHVAECDGGGPLVVLLHGFPQFWWAWRHQLTGLAGRGLRVAAVDLRGYGDSDKPPRGYDLWTLAGDVAGLVRALGEPRAHLVGHGWGGLIGWTVAALHPRVVRSLTVLGAPHPLAVRRAVLRGQDRSTVRHALRTQVPRLPERALVADGGTERLLRAWSGPDWPASPDFAAAAAQYSSAARIPGVAHCSAEYYRWAARSQLRVEGHRFAAAVARPAEVPVLAVHGALDPCVLEPTVAASRRWVDGGFRLEVLPGSGHFPHEECPDEVTALIADSVGRE